MKTTRIQQFFDGANWHNDVVVSTNQNIIQCIEAAAEFTGTISNNKGIVIPGFQNAHSHAFQYDIVGLTEHIPVEANGDDFWSWRNEMYKRALTYTPEDVKRIATKLYQAMRRSGYTSVAEFHYLHNDVQGKPYADRAIMGRMLVEAAKEADLNITLVPVYYHTSGFGQPANEGQRRFLCSSVEDYQTLIEASAQVVGEYEHARLGVGAHSLRAAPIDHVKEIFGAYAELPKHLHIAEQTAEIEQCLAATGKRSVEYLLDNIDIDDSVHLVHTTHVMEHEWKGVADAGAHVVMCPTTEGNLGDGFFPLKEYHAYGGSWSIGSDSHVSTCPRDELRVADYGQRLLHRQRNVFCQPGQDSGYELFTRTWRSGRRAMGRPMSTNLQVGDAFEVIECDGNHELADVPQDRLLAALLFGSPGIPIVG